MRKIKECLRDSVETRTVDGIKIMPFDLPVFLSAMTMALLGDACMRIEYNLDGTKTGKKAKIDDCVKVFSGNDMIRWTHQQMQLEGFLRWFMEQEEPSEESEEPWYYWTYVMDKWNEYAKENGARV